MTSTRRPTFTAAFDTTPVIGQPVTGTTTITHPSGAERVTTWAGTYDGLRPSEWDGEPMHFLRDGVLGVTPQGIFGIPAAQFPEVRPLMDVLAEHVATVTAARTA